MSCSVGTTCLSTNVSICFCESGEIGLSSISLIFSKTQLSKLIYSNYQQFINVNQQRNLKSDDMTETYIHDNDCCIKINSKIIMEDDLDNIDTLQKMEETIPKEEDSALVEMMQPISQPPVILNEPEQEWFGINKSLYRFSSRPDFTIRTGLDYQLLPGNPHFIEPQNEESYPVYEPKLYILEEAIKRDIQIIIHMNTLLNKIVYDQNEPALTKTIDPKSHAVDMLPYFIPTSQNDTTLIFEARFQTGNLRRAIQILEYEYQIILRADWNTTSHTQWFYFSVANTRKDVEYKFMIINLMKPDSLYNSGMKPLFYSDKQAKQKNIGWYRDAYDVCYYQNNLKRKNGDFYHTLTFSVKFPYDNDTVYIAHSYPYTYSRLQNFLKEIEIDPKRKHLLQRKILCQTVAGNNCDQLIISDFNNGKQKKGIFLTSRVHPGEPMASYVIEYIIQYLLGNSSIAKVLRENFIFKIVPMLNPDGVIVGNYRCNLSLVDLNRQWIDPNKKLHPTIYNAKQMIKRMKQQRDFVLYCDFHGHSRKKNCFMYGCNKDASKKEQVFPAIVKTNLNTFSFKDCCFQIQKDREGASRIALWRELNLTNCFTFEISFCGPDTGKYQFKHFNLLNYRDMGDKFCESIYDYSEPDSAKVAQAIRDLEENILRNDKNDDDSDGDDSDYEKPENGPTKGGESKGKDEIKLNSGNQMIIKKKVVPVNLQIKKKK